MRFASLRTWSLWTVQVVLAAVFLFAGITKLVMHSEALVGSSAVPAGFYRFIGLCEILGALGLVLPGAFRIRRELTPIAAGALVIVMSGAVGTTLPDLGLGAALLPGVTGLLCGFVAYGRRGWIPVRRLRPRAGGSASVVPQPSRT